MPLSRSLIAGLGAAGLLAASLAFAPASHTDGRTITDGGAPTDYIAQADTLSQPDYPDTITEALQIPAHDGELLYVEVTRPDPAVYGDEQFPVVMEASPYHGTIASRIGDRIFPDPTDEQGNKLGLTGYFAPRGYAVAIMDLRGTGRSGGCLDHLGPNDAQDLRTVIEHLADADWSAGKVGMTGHSYVGSTPMTATELDPRGLATIVPSAGLASMYDHQFQGGVPYSLQYIGPMVAYEALALDRHLPGFVPSVLGDQTGDDFGNNVEDTGCGLANSAAISGSGQLTGQYELWHAQRDHRQAATDAEIPVFMVHGVNDNAARIPAAEWFFGDRFDRDQDKVWIGQWDHGSTNGRCGDESGARTLHPTCRFDQFQYALHAWFDKHLKGMDVDTGPAVEAFLNPEGENLDPGSVIDPATVDNKVLTADSWSRPGNAVRFYPDATDGSLATSPPTDAGTASYSVNAQGLLVTSTTSVEFTSAPLDDELVLLGLPQLALDISQTAASTDIVVTLFNEDADGNRTPINTCAIDAILRDGVETLSPIVPTQVMRVEPQCFTAAHVVPAGNSLVLQVGGNGPHHAELGTTGDVTIHTGPGAGGYDLPKVTDPVLHDDVPLREQ